MTADTLKQAGELLQAKKISAVELAQEYLAAIDARNPAINGYITLDKDKTLAEAQAADARIAAGNAGALTGVPIAYKDIFCQTGWRSACSSKNENGACSFGGKAASSSRLTSRASSVPSSTVHADSISSPSPVRSSVSPL